MGNFVQAPGPPLVFWVSCSESGNLVQGCSVRVVGALERSLAHKRKWVQEWSRCNVGPVAGRGLLGRLHCAGMHLSHREAHVVDFRLE